MMDTLAHRHELPRSFLIAQVAIVLFTIEGALWTHGRTQVYWFVTAFAALILCLVVSRPKIKDLGIGTDGLLRASLSIPVALLLSATILAASWMLGTLGGLHGDRPVSWHAILYTIWAFEQQFILNAFFYNRLEALLGNNSGAVLVTALLFSVVHLPNPVLVPATFLGGIFFVSIYRRWRNIYPLAIAHAMLGLTLAMTFPSPWIRHMRVGIGYFRFDLG